MDLSNGYESISKEFLARRYEQHELATTGARNDEEKNDE
jgi:hypothetical protein